MKTLKLNNKNIGLVAIMVKLKEISEIKTGRNYDEEEGSEIKKVNPESITQKGSIDLSKTKPVSGADLKKEDICQKNDLIISIVGPKNKVGLVEDDNLVPSQYCVNLHFNNEEEAKDVHEYLLSKEGQEKLSKNKTGEALPRISISDLKEIDVPL